MLAALLLLTFAPSAVIWWIVFGHYAPQPSNTAAIAAHRLRRLL